MADETTTGNTADGVESETSAVIPAVKKTRAPRRTKAAMEAAATAPSAVKEKPAKAVRAKRGSKIAAAKTETAVTAPKKTVTAKASSLKASVRENPASADILDGIADLIQLEEENKRLRKQLAEKLRAENADLRKRLGQA